MNHIFSLLLIVLLSLIGVIGDLFIKLAGSGSKYIDVKWFILGFVIYACTAVGWFFAMKNVKLATLGVWYTLSTVLLITLLGTVYFKEHVNGYEVLGIIMAIISLSLMARFA